MKNLNCLFIALCIIVLGLSCNSESDKLVGSWHIFKAITMETAQGKTAGEESELVDKELKATFSGGSLELRKDKTATLKTKKSSEEFTWKMNNGTLELYKSSKNNPDIIFFPGVDGADLIYMKDINSIVAKVLFTESNTQFWFELAK